MNLKTVFWRDCAEPSYVCIGALECGAEEAGVGEVGDREIGAVEDGSTKLGALELSTVELGLGEVWDDLTGLPPAVPLRHAFRSPTQQLERFFPRHRFFLCHSRHCMRTGLKVEDRKIEG